MLYEVITTWVIAGPSRPRGRGAVEPETPHVEVIDEEIDDSNGMIFTHPVRQSLRKQRRLIALDALNKFV